MFSFLSSVLTYKGSYAITIKYLFISQTFEPELRRPLVHLETFAVDNVIFSSFVRSVNLVERISLVNSRLSI